MTKGPESLMVGSVWVKSEQDRLGQPAAQSEASDEESNNSLTPEGQTELLETMDDVEPPTVAADTKE